MTNLPPQPPFQPNPPSGDNLLLPAPPTPKRRRWLLPVLVAAGVVLLLAVAVVITAAITSSTTPSAKPSAPSAWDREQAANAGGAGENGVPTTEPTTAAVKLTVADVTLRVKIKSQECYGSGLGCDIEYEIEADWPSEKVADGQQYDVTYEVSGVKNGPSTNTLTIISPTEFEQDSYQSAETTKRVKTLKVKVTDVELQYGG